MALTRGKLSFTTPRLGGLKPAYDSDCWIAARLNVDTGELLLEPDRAQHPDAQALLAPLRDALDGALLDDFARLWLRLKHQPPATDEPIPDPDFGDGLPGQTLAFGQVFEEPRIDSYLAGERLYEAVDLYCPDPDCDCSAVTVDFADPAGDSSAGAATIDLATGDVRFRHDLDDETLVPDLWQRFVFRHRGVGLLFDRLKRMKGYGETLFEELEQPPEVSASTLPSEATGRRATKIGRNEPCPCGSGKKYKKCCLPGLSP